MESAVSPRWCARRGDPDLPRGIETAVSYSFGLRNSTTPLSGII